jgi:hypothetical protein
MPGLKPKALLALAEESFNKMHENKYNIVKLKRRV